MFIVWWNSWLSTWLVSSIYPRFRLLLFFKLKQVVRFDLPAVEDMVSVRIIQVDCLTLLYVRTFTARDPKQRNIFSFSFFLSFKSSKLFNPMCQSRWTQCDYRDLTCSKSSEPSFLSTCTTAALYIQTVQSHCTITNISWCTSAGWCSPKICIILPTYSRTKPSVLFEPFQTMQCGTLIRS